MKRRKPLLFSILIALIIYIGLLILLTLVEHGRADANIHTVWDAFWYSLVTLTTVGYGDFTPVSRIGQIIGIVFLAGSIVLLSAVVGAFMSLFTGELLPMMKLKMRQHQQWYVFTDDNENSRSLAFSLLQEDSNRVIAFLHPTAERAVLRHMELTPDSSNMKDRKSHYADIWHLPITAEMLAEKHEKARRTLICIKPNSLENVADAKNALPLGYKVVCVTNVAMDQLPSNVNVFQPIDSIARQYWTQHPLRQEEQTVLFIGCGRYGEKLLEKALLINVFSLDQDISYHVFGNSTRFQMRHSHLWDAIQTDHIYFHKEEWEHDIQLLRSADRIIICTDDDEKNLLIEQELRQFFSDTVPVYLLLSEDTIHDVKALQKVPTIRFGFSSSTFTTNTVLHQRLDRLPWAMNEYYRHRNLEDALPWEQLPDLMQQYYYSSADHLYVKVRLLLQDESLTDMTAEQCLKAYGIYKQQLKKDPDHFRSMEHMRWTRFYYMYNWEYGPVRDENSRQHPNLKPYDLLTPDESARYELQWNVLTLVPDILRNRS